MLRNTLNTFITATFIMLLGVSSSAQAIVPAGNLMGTTSVTWGEETASEIQTSVQSILVPAAPILLGPADQTSISGASLVSDDALQYTITSNANGEDKYALTLEIVSAGVEDAGVPVVVGVEGGMVTLGATAAMEAAPAGATEIKVPSDGVIDTAVNGITNGDTVRINDKEYTVGEVVEDDNYQTDIIHLTTDGGLISPVAFGDRIAQQETFAVSLDNVGTITDDAGETGAVTITVTATSASDPWPRSADDVAINLLTPVGPSVEKYVRNVTPENDRNPAEDNLETWVDQGFAYEYPSGSGTFYFRSQLNDGTREDEALVKAEEDDTLKYLIVLKAGNQKDQTDIMIKETLSPFVEYVPSTATLVSGSSSWVEVPALVEFAWKQTNLVVDWPPLDAYEISPITKSAYFTYEVKVGGEETVPGGDGGDIDLSTPEGIELACNGSNPESFDKDLCHLQPWVADNGVDVATNPVCWDTNKTGDGWQVGGNNPWVVGTAAEYNIEAYDCRTKCADKSGESFGHCAADGWWDNDAAKSTVCEVAGEENASLVANYVDHYGVGSPSCVVL